MGSEGRGQTILVLALIILAAFSLRMQAFTTFPCPSGSDPGLRVKNAYLLSREWVNITYPAFDATLSLLWTNTGESTKGLIASTELFVSAVMALCAASMYGVSTRILRDRRASLVVAFLAAFSAPTYELVAFGSYPQGLSLFLIPLIFSVGLNKRMQSNISKAASLGMLAASLLMAHFWSFAICSLAILFFWMANLTRSTLGKPPQDGSMAGKMLIAAPILALLFSSPWWIPIFSFLQKTLLYAPVGATSIRGVGWRFERFFSPYWLYYVFLPAGLAGFYSRRATQKAEGLMLLGSWLLTPFVLMQGYRFGVGADYRRLWYYPMEPAMIVAGLGISLSVSLFFYAMRKVISHKSSETKQLTKLGNSVGMTSNSNIRQIRSVLALSAILFFAAVLYSPGWWAAREANASTRYYSHIKEPELGMMFWIGEHVEEGQEILSGGSVGWWIRGLARRHVISVIPRAFINVPWQISRAETLGILVSEASYAIRNEWIQVRDSGSYWSGLNPELSIKSGGDYRSVMHLNDTGIVLRLSNGQKISLASMPGRESSWISREEDGAILQTRYSSGALTAVKTMTLLSSSRFAEIDLKIDGIQAEIQDLTVTAYPDDELRDCVILAEGFEQTINGETASYSTPRSKWFAVYDSKNDLCFLVRLREETRAQFDVDSGRVLSFKFDPKVEETKSTIEIGGFPVKDRAELKESLKRYLGNAQTESDPEATTTNVSTLDYLEILREYRIRIVVIGTIEKHARDPHFNLVFSTPGKVLFESP